jgi:hypothetical protein
VRSLALGARSVVTLCGCALRPHLLLSLKLLCYSWAAVHRGQCAVGGVVGHVQHEVCGHRVVRERPHCGSRLRGVGGSGPRRLPKNSPPTFTQEIPGILPTNPISSPPSPIQSIADRCVSISSTTTRAPSILTSCWTSCARRPRIVSTSCRGGRQVFSFYLFFKIKTTPLSFTCFYVECVQIGIRESKS